MPHEDLVEFCESGGCFTGCLLGLAVGDALGAPYEGLPAAHIFHHFGEVSSIVRNPSGDTLYYTDDTEMMIGVAETLVDRGTIEEPIRAFAENYHPERGYGQGARRIIERMVKGKDHRKLARTIFPGGSFGNGTAVASGTHRVAFSRDLDEVWRQAALSSEPTHTHPVGVEGAQILAVAIAMVLTAETFDRSGFYSELRRRAQTEEFQWHLKVASRLRPGDPVSVLGSTLLAHRSVVTSLACFASSPGDFERSVGLAIALGDDTDTLAAMRALVGAFGGIAAIPTGLLEKLEDGPPKGRSHIAKLASGLLERVQES